MDGMSLQDAPDWSAYDGPYGPYGPPYGPPPPPPRRKRPVAAVLAGLLIAAGSVGLSVGVDALMDRSNRDGYEFMAHQPGDPNDPVTYNPCRTIRVVVNPDGAPADWESLVETSLDHVGDASGLKLALVDETDERPSERRPSEDEQYGAGWTPVLVAWADPSEVPGLGGNTAGLGGSQAEWVDGRLYWVTGAVTLDTIDFTVMRHDSQQAVLDHEFAHVVGLNHVDDPDPLMFAENYGREEFGPGDLKGLKALGDARCPD